MSDAAHFAERQNTVRNWLTLEHGTKLITLTLFDTKTLRARWLCRCDCGTEKVVTGKDLVSGNTKSCGCAKQGVNRTHGMSSTTGYRIWKSMRGRTGEEARGADFVSTDHGQARVMITCHNWRMDTHTGVMLKPEEAKALGRDLIRRADAVIESQKPQQQMESPIERNQ